MTTELHVTSPYKGLAPFEDSELDALMFFGRERESEIVAMNLLASRLTVLYGPTGVGKSSLLGAGVARRLRDLAPEGEVVVFSSWRDDPVAGIREAIAPGGETSSLVDAVDARGADVYLVLDQFEEYFLYHADERGPGSLVEELPELVNGDARVNVMLGIREDALAKLDVFKARLPRLFGNYLRLDHLDREAARDAILGPLARYGELTGEEWGAQPELVEAVLDQVEAGKIDIGQSGRALVERGARPRVEAPFLQLVLHRLWEVERAAGSTTLTSASLAALGGAARIVEDHLEHALGTLSPVQQDTAAAIFEHLVTPSGSKIAHRLSDLATYASLDTHSLEPIVGALEHERILRALRDGTNGDGHYEIYHDVLAGAVLQWRERHEAQRELELERSRARERHRRTLAALAVVGVALAVMTGLTIYAFSQRSEARSQAAIARTRQVQLTARQHALESALASVRVARRKADAAAKQLEVTNDALVSSNRKLKDKSRESAANLELARHNLAVANASKRSLQTALRQLKSTLASLTISRDNERLAVGKAQRETRLAKQTSRALQKANSSLESLNTQLKIGRLVALALANLNADPAASLALAAKAAKLGRNDEIENALRQALVTNHLHAVLPGGGGELTAAIYSKDGALIGLAAGKGVTIIRARDYRRLHFFENPNATTLALSPDGSLVASGAKDGAVRIWATSSGALVRTLTTGGGVVALAFSPNGQTLLAASGDKVVRLWQVGSFVELLSIRHPAALRGAFYSPDGALVVTFTSDPNARVYSVASGSLVATLPQQGEITAGAYSPTGDTVTTTGRRNAYIWDAKTWAQTPRHLLVGHSAAIHAVAYSVDGTRVGTVGVEGVGRVWSVASGDMVYPLVGHYNELLSIAFAPDGSMATSSTDRTVRIWRDPLGSLGLVLAGHADSVSTVTFAPSGLVLTGSDDGDARVWDAGGEPRLTRLDKHEAGATSLDVNRSGTLAVSGGGDGVARIWRLGKPAVVLPHGGKVVEAALDRSGGRVLTWGDEGTAKLWRADGTRLAEFANGAPINAAALSPDGRLVLTADDNGFVRLWRASGARVAAMQEGGKLVAATFGGDGALAATAGADGVARIWNGRTGAPLQLLRGHTDAITAIAFSPDGRRLATASLDDTARIWNVRTGAVEHVLEGKDLGLTSVTFDRSGRLVLAAGRKGDARTWNVGSGVVAKVFRGHVSVVSDARFSPDGRWVVTAGPTAAGVWNTKDASRLFFLRGHTQALRTAVFSGDGRWIFTAGAVDGTVQRYRCELCGDQRELERLANARLTALDRAHKAASGR